MNARAWRILIGLAALAAIIIGPTEPKALAQATCTVGLDFVTENQPIDFLPHLPGQPNPHYMMPFTLTGGATQYVQDGGFAGYTEAQVQKAIVAQVEYAYYRVPTPIGTELNVDFVQGRVSGAKTINAIFGAYSIDRPGVSADHWYGYSLTNGGLGAEADGANNAAIAVDEIDTLPIQFTTFDTAVRTIGNVAAHEVGHLFSLDHVAAAPGFGSPVVTNPYDLMATIPSGLPPAAWADHNIFTTVAGTQTGGRSSVQELIANLGLRRLGDSNRDGLVNATDLDIIRVNFTGAATPFTLNKAGPQGDVDHDRDVDTADALKAYAYFSAALAGNLSETGNADLIYDPATGIVSLDAGQGLAITSFVLGTTSGAFSLGAAAFPFTNTGANTDATAFQIGQFDTTLTGFTGKTSLGAILPTGLTLGQVESFFSQADYVGSLGSGTYTFDLSVVPEPTALGLLALGAGLLLLLGRRPSR